MTKKKLAPIAEAALSLAPDVEVAASELHTALKATAAHMSKDVTTRPHLNAIHIAADPDVPPKHLALVGTDGTRLIRVSVYTGVEVDDWEPVSITGDESARLLLNLRSIKSKQEKLRLSVERGADGYGVRVGRYGVFLAEAEKFPPYRKVIPARYERVVDEEMHRAHLTLLENTIRDGTWEREEALESVQALRQELATLASKVPHAWGMNPVYMREAGQTFAEIFPGGVAGVLCEPVENPEAPIRYEARSEAHAVTLVIMPMRMK